MKYCTGCGRADADDAMKCAQCGSYSFAYDPPEGHQPPVRSTNDVPPEEGSTSVLTVLGVIFYLAAGVNLIAAMTYADDGPFAIAIFLAGAVSTLFFGGICFAANDVRTSLRNIEGLLARGAQTAPLTATLNISDTEITAIGDNQRKHPSNRGAAKPNDVFEICVWCQRSVKAPSRPCSQFSRSEIASGKVQPADELCEQQLAMR